jgi:hypothetical protein
MNINLHIERLILDDVGIKSHQKNEIKAAVEAALKQQLVNQGIDSTMKSSNNCQLIKGDSISIENISKPTSIGQQIGNAVYKGIRK